MACFASRRSGVKGFRRLAVLISIIGSLAGCASAPIQAPVATMAPPSGGNARVVVIRQENGFVGFGDRSFRIQLDGESMGEVMTGAIVSADRPAGPHHLTADLWDFPGVTRREFTAQAGRTYYFRAQFDEEPKDVDVLKRISPLGGLIVASATYCGDRGKLIPLSDAEARDVMARLKVS